MSSARSGHAKVLPCEIAEAQHGRLGVAAQPSRASYVKHWLLEAWTIFVHSVCKCTLVGHFLLYTHCLLRILQPFCIAQHTGCSQTNLRLLGAERQTQGQWAILTDIVAALALTDHIQGAVAKLQVLVLLCGFALHEMLCKWPSVPRKQKPLVT